MFSLHGSSYCFLPLIRLSQKPVALGVFQWRRHIIVFFSKITLMFFCFSVAKLSFTRNWSIKMFFLNGIIYCHLLCWLYSVWESWELWYGLHWMTNVNVLFCWTWWLLYSVYCTTLETRVTWTLKWRWGHGRGTGPTAWPSWWTAGCHASRHDVPPTYMNERYKINR